MGDILASDFTIYNYYGISLGNNQYQLSSGSLDLQQDAPISQSGIYRISIQIRTIIGFDSGVRTATIRLANGSSASSIQTNQVEITSNDQTFTLIGEYTVPSDQITNYPSLEIVIGSTVSGAQVEIYNGTYTIVSKTVILPLMGGGKVVIPIVTPDVGDKCVVIPLQGGGNVVKKLVSPQKGDKVVVLPLRGGGKVVIPLNDQKHT